MTESKATLPELDASILDAKRFSTSPLLNNAKVVFQSLKGVARKDQLEEGEATEAFLQDLHDVWNVLLSSLAHPSDEVRLYRALCLAEVLRICSPESPFSSGRARKREVEVVFRFIFAQLEAGLGDQTALSFRAYYELLEAIEGPSTLLFLVSEGRGDLVADYMAMCFRLVGSTEELNSRVEYKLSHMMEEVVLDFPSVPNDVIRALLLLLKPRNPYFRLPQRAAAQRLLFQVLTAGVDRLDTAVLGFLHARLSPNVKLSLDEQSSDEASESSSEEAEDMEDEQSSSSSEDEDEQDEDEEAKEGDESSSEFHWKSSLGDKLPRGELNRRWALNVVRGCLRHSPLLMRSAVPLLMEIMEVEQVNHRLEVVQLLADHFCVQRAAEKPFDQLLGALCRRLDDVSPDVRASLSYRAGTLLQTYSDMAESLELHTRLENRVLDSNEKVRETVVQSLCRLAESDPTLVGKELIYTIGGRCLDKKRSVALTTLRCMARLFAIHCAAYWRAAKPLPSSSVWFTAVPTQLMSAGTDEVMECEIERLVDETLLPGDFSVRERTMCLLGTFAAMGSGHRGHFQNMLLRKSKLRRLLTRTLFIHRQLRRLRSGKDFFGQPNSSSSNTDEASDAKQKHTPRRSSRQRTSGGMPVESPAESKDGDASSSPSSSSSSSSAEKALGRQQQVLVADLLQCYRRMDAHMQPMVDAGVVQSSVPSTLNAPGMTAGVDKMGVTAKTVDFLLTRPNNRLRVLVQRLCDPTQSYTELRACRTTLWKAFRASLSKGRRRRGSKDLRPEQSLLWLLSSRASPTLCNAEACQVLCGEIEQKLAKVDLARACLGLLRVVSDTIPQSVWPCMDVMVRIAVRMKELAPDANDDLSVEFYQILAQCRSPWVTGDDVPRKTQRQQEVMASKLMEVLSAVARGYPLVQLSHQTREGDSGGPQAHWTMTGQLADPGLSLIAAHRAGLAVRAIFSLFHLPPVTAEQMVIEELLPIRVDARRPAFLLETDKRLSGPDAVPTSGMEELESVCTHLVQTLPIRAVVAARERAEKDAQDAQDEHKESEEAVSCGHLMIVMNVLLAVAEVAPKTFANTLVTLPGLEDGLPWLPQEQSPYACVDVVVGFTESLLSVPYTFRSQETDGRPRKTTYDMFTRVKTKALDLLAAVLHPLPALIQRGDSEAKQLARRLLPEIFRSFLYALKAEGRNIPILPKAVEERWRNRMIEKQREKGTYRPNKAIEPQDPYHNDIFLHVAGGLLTLCEQATYRGVLIEDRYLQLFVDHESSGDMLRSDRDALLRQVPTSSGAPASYTFFLGDLAGVLQCGRASVRQRFLDMLCDRLVQGKLPCFPFASFLCLAAQHPGEQVERAKTTLRLVLQRFRAKARQSGGRLPPVEMTLADTLYLLAHHPDWDDTLHEGDTVEWAHEVYDYFLKHLQFFIDALLSATKSDRKATGDFALLMHIVSLVRNCEDARFRQIPESSRQGMLFEVLPKMCELALIALRQRYQHKTWESSGVPAGLRLPTAQFVARTSAPKARYLPASFYKLKDMDATGHIRSAGEKKKKKKTSTARTAARRKKPVRSPARQSRRQRRAAATAGDASSSESESESEEEGGETSPVPKRRSARRSAGGVNYNEQSDSSSGEEEEEEEAGSEPSSGSEESDSGFSSSEDQQGGGSDQENASDKENASSASQSTTSKMSRRGKRGRGPASPSDKQLMAQTQSPPKRRTGLRAAARRALRNRS